MSLAEYAIDGLEPASAGCFGLNGVILLAYIVAIPANEIVIPTILMLTVLVTGASGVGAGAGVMFELDSVEATGRSSQAGGWTLLTAVNLMLFSLLHNPCSTTIYTIWKETRSAQVDGCRGPAAAGDGLRRLLRRRPGLAHRGRLKAMAPRAGVLAGRSRRVETVGGDRSTPWETSKLDIVSCVLYFSVCQGSMTIRKGSST